MQLTRTPFSLRRLLLATLVLLPLTAAADDPVASGERVILHTNKGDITIALYPDKAPQAVANFLQYARDGFYTNTLFHRVKSRSLIQGGGFDISGVEKETREPVVNESDNGLRNTRWSVGAARRADPDSANSQFYINLGMNFEFDPRFGKPGYTVFGVVTDGQAVVRDISLVKTHSTNGFNDVPVEPVVIERVEIVPAATAAVETTVETTMGAAP